MAEQLEHKTFEIRGEARYCVVGPMGAVDFHCADINHYDPIAGLECHYRFTTTTFGSRRSRSTCYAFTGRVFVGPHSTWDKRETDR